MLFNFMWIYSKVDTLLVFCLSQKHEASYIDWTQITQILWKLAWQFEKASWIWLCFNVFMDSYRESDSWTKCQGLVQPEAVLLYNALKYPI